jgi:hypothetical protein
MDSEDQFISEVFTWLGTDFGQRWQQIKNKIAHKNTIILWFPLWTHIQITGLLTSWWEKAVHIKIGRNHKESLCISLPLIIWDFG